MSYTYDYDYFPTELLSMFAGSWFISLAVSALAIVALWKVFVKAGEEGWAAIIPFYNMYILYKITWGNGWLFLLLFTAIIPVVGWIAVAVIHIITMVKLAKAFGKTGGFAVGLVLLNIVFMCIIAFSKDIEYLGVPDKDGGFKAGSAAAAAGAAGYQTNYQQTQDRFSNAYQQQSAQNSDYHYQRTETPAEEPKGGFCPQCGAAVEAGTKFCHSCGRKL